MIEEREGKEVRVPHPPRLLSLCTPDLGHSHLSLLPDSYSSVAIVTQKVTSYVMYMLSTSQLIPVQY